LVFANPTADMRAHDIKIKRHRRRWIDTHDYETSKLLKPSWHEFTARVSV
jgi:hypothetical protein